MIRLPPQILISLHATGRLKTEYAALASPALTRVPDCRGSGQAHLSC